MGMRVAGPAGPWEGTLVACSVTPLPAAWLAASAPASLGGAALSTGFAANWRRSSGRGPLLRHPPADLRASSPCCAPPSPAPLVRPARNAPATPAARDPRSASGGPALPRPGGRCPAAARTASNALRPAAPARRPKPDHLAARAAQVAALIAGGGATVTLVLGRVGVLLFHGPAQQRARLTSYPPGEQPRTVSAGRRCA